MIFKPENWANYERIAELDRAIQELAQRLGFEVTEINITDMRDREHERPRLTVYLEQKQVNNWRDHVPSAAI